MAGSTPEARPFAGQTELGKPKMLTTNRYSRWPRLALFCAFEVEENAAPSDQHDAKKASGIFNDEIRQPISNLRQSPARPEGVWKVNGDGALGTNIARLPYLFALFLAGGSLLVYLIGAVVSQYMFPGKGKTDKTFNLAIPHLNMPSEDLFAISLAAAQTTFSTVFVVFLADAGTMGLHFLYCPLAFGAGNWVMLHVYTRVAKQGFLDDSSISGLIPYFIYKITKSPFVSYCVLVACIVPLVALLALELHYGNAYIDYLVHGALGLSPHAASGGNHTHLLPSVIFFIVFIVLLLGYVFVGGFRAVIASDVWQYRIMLATLALTCASVLIDLVLHRQETNWSGLLHPALKQLVPFYVKVTLINLFQPLCFATTWQRFRAFQERPINFTTAVKKATVKVAYLWTMLIFIGVGLQLLSPAAQTHENVSDFLDRICGLGLWFQLFVFPLIIMAGFSGMYSSSDTCISALLYLTELNRAWRRPHLLNEIQLRKHYYWVMLALFAMTLAFYAFINAATQRPTEIAVMLFSNALVLAPSVFLLTRISPGGQHVRLQSRSIYILSSIVGGLLAYWLLATVGKGIQHWALAGALVASGAPAGLLIKQERASKKEVHRVGSIV